MNYRTFGAFALGLLLLGAVEAGQPAPQQIPSGAKLYVAPMEWGLDRFVTAAVIRQALPVQLVSSEDEADYVMTSMYQKLGSHLIAPGHYIQVKIVANHSGNPVWADEVNDFAVFFGRLRRHGPGRAAQSIVRKLGHRMFGVR